MWSAFRSAWTPRLVSPDLVAVLVRQAPGVARPLDLPLDGVVRDRSPAHGARASGAPPGDREAAGREEPAVAESLPHVLPQRLGGEVAAAGDVATRRPTRAPTPVAPRAQHEEQPSDIAFFLHVR